MKRKVDIPVEITVSLRSQGATKDGRGHLMLNDRAICGEPVHKNEPVPIDWKTFTKKTCKKCRGLLERGSFGAK